MIKKILILLLITSLNAQAIDLFKAEYTVFKGGKKTGANTIELSKDAPFYKLSDKTTGTHGMASFLGFKRSEDTLFTEDNGQLIPESYEMKQKVAFNKRSSDYQVDKESHTAYGNHKGDEWQTKIPSNFYTPNLVSLKLFSDVCAGKKSGLSYPVLKRSELITYNFKIASEKNGIIEVDKIHSKATRVTKTWLDTKQHCLPVRTYHKEKDEDAIESKLVKVSFD